MNKIVIVTYSNETEVMKLLDEKAERKLNNTFSKTNSSFNGNVICLNIPDGMFSKYTVGKVYHVENGVITNDEGERTSEFADEFEGLHNTPAMRWMEVRGEAKVPFNGPVLLKKDAPIGNDWYARNTLFLIAAGRVVEEDSLNLPNRAKYTSFQEFNTANQCLFEQAFWAATYDDGEEGLCARVFCVNTPSDSAFTAGHIYPIDDGALFCNEGHMHFSGWENVQDFCADARERGYGVFIPVVEE